MNLIGKKVFGIDGAGQSPKTDLAGNEGIIVAEESGRWGDFWIVEWRNGNEEAFSKHTVKPTKEFNGIGVYYQEDEQKGMRDMDNIDYVDIAETTIHYLGGFSKIKAMVNGKYFTYDKDGSLQFHFSGNKNMNIVKFTLTSLDLYKVTFYKFNNRTLKLKMIEEIDGLYGDQIKRVFETTTGLYLSL